jgi:hypothetical protein
MRNQDEQVTHGARVWSRWRGLSPGIAGAVAIFAGSFRFLVRAS